MRRTVSAVAVAVALVLGACGGGGSDGDTVQQGGQAKTDEGTPANGSAPAAGVKDVRPDDDIDLTDDTVVVASDGGKAVKSFGSDGKTIVIDAGADGADELAEGKILLLTGVTVVRVASVERDGDDLVIEGAPVTLPEVIENGELAWDDVEVDADSARMLLIDDSGPAGGAAPGASGTPGAGLPGLGGGGGISGSGGLDIPTEEQLEEELGDINDILSGGSGGDDMLFGRPAYGPGDMAGAAVVAARPVVAGKTISGELQDVGFDITYEPDGAGHHLNLQLKPSGDDLAGRFGIDVKITSLAHSGRTKVVDGRVQTFDLTMNDLSGEATIETDLQGLQNVANLIIPPFFDLPLSIEFPVLVGGIPFTLSLSGTIQVNLAMALAPSSLSGKAEISFGGPAGFHFKDGSVTLDGQRVQDAPDLLNLLKGAAPGPVGMVFTTELPKIGFGFGFLQTGASVFIANGMVASQTILPPPVPCTAMNVAYVLAGGVEAKFLGVDFEIARKPFVSKEWHYQAPQDQRCNAPK